MNIPIPPKQVVAAVPARRPPAEPSFADAITAIEADTDLALHKKRHWPTALRQMAGYLDKPLTLIPARVAAIRLAVAALHPERLNVHAKTFANHRANVKAALLWFNRVTHGDGRRALMSDAYRAMLKRVEDRHVQDTLSPFFRFLTAWAIEPSEVTDAAVESFVQSTGETRFKPYSIGDRRRLVRCWNAHAGSAPGWHATQLTEPPRSPTTTGVVWEDLPESFRDEVDAYFESLTCKRRSHKGRRLPGCKPSTIAMRRRELQAAVRTGVAAGIVVEDLQHLEDLLAPARVEIILDTYWRRSGERPSAHTIELSWRFLTMARERQLSAGDLERLEEMALSFSDHRRTGLTDKNREVVRHVVYGDTWSKVVHLPARMMAEARTSRATQPVKAAILAQLAVAVRALTFAPVRMANLGAIRIGENLVRPGGPGTPLLLVFPDYDVKNGVPLEFPLDEATTAIIDEYVQHHRPTLMRGGGNHDFLFPGTAHDQKLTRGLGMQISERLWKLLGLKITPHQFRHAAAAIILKNDPGNYELVRRVLGHRNLQTTTNFYVGLETASATQRFGELVLRGVSNADINARSPRRGR